MHEKKGWLVTAWVRRSGFYSLDMSETMWSYGYIPFGIYYTNIHCFAGTKLG